MCGVCGFASAEGIPENSKQIVEEMCRRMIHRGPDEQGVYADRFAAIGMRRLSIIDLSGGSQPIFNEDNTICVVQNGEIYNFQELRAELVQRGHRFRTNSDTETIVHLYEEYGLEFPSKLNGMFAIAIWDMQRQRLVLARDRLGQKPLYYSCSPSGIAFASEIKCLRVLESVSTELDPRAVLNYFTLGYINEPHSIYRSIRKLPPGTVAVLEKSGETQLSKYWHLPNQIDRNLTLPDATEKVRETLSDAIKIRMISDVPLGAFLSGGLDSSIVVAEMAKHSSVPVKTFFIDFDEATHSEREFARCVAAEYGTDHHELTAIPSGIDLLDELVHYFDEPFADSSAIPTYLVSKLTREHVTVALAGDGGDESFGGYSRYRRILGRRNLPTLRKFTQPVAHLSRLLPGGFPGRKFLKSLPLDNVELYGGGVLESEARQFLSNDFLRGVDKAVSEELWESIEAPAGDMLSAYTKFDLNWYLPGDILVKVDRMSMAHSLEVRAPFLDFRLVELASRLPEQWKIGINGSKKILKEAFQKQLPAKILEQRKRGFSLPLANWLRGELRPQLEGMCTDPLLIESGIFRPKGVRKLVDEHLTGRRSRASQIWRLMFFLRWLRNQPAQKCGLAIR
jgi:asparagine synthase (glutamine-hydrolysing)